MADVEMTESSGPISIVSDRDENKYTALSLKKMAFIKDKVIQDFIGESTDGIHIDGQIFAHVKNCLISQTHCTPDAADELASIVNGADAIFYRCRFMDNGKGYLQGTGDTPDRDLFQGQRVFFHECIFENNSRRNPFIQIGQGYMTSCLIKDWGKNFHVKSFGARAGAWGQLMISNCVFLQEDFKTCLKRGHLFRDIFQQYLWPLPLIPGFMRGAYADHGGHVYTHDCYKNHWWIYLQNRHGKMSEANANRLVTYLEDVVPHP